MRACLFSSAIRLSVRGIRCGCHKEDRARGGRGVEGGWGGGGGGNGGGGKGGVLGEKKKRDKDWESNSRLHQQMQCGCRASEHAPARFSRVRQRTGAGQLHLRSMHATAVSCCNYKRKKQRTCAQVALTNL